MDEPGFQQQGHRLIRGIAGRRGGAIVLSGEAGAGWPLKMRENQ
jgi:hypothetical protein